MAQGSSHLFGFGALAGGGGAPATEAGATGVERGPIDVILLFAVGALVTMGLVTVYGASALESMFEHGNHARLYEKQVQGAVVGVVALLFAMRMDYRIYRRWIYAIFVGSFVLLSLTLFDATSSEFLGARRWVRLGPVSFQPAEIVKLATVMYMAYSVAKKGAAVQNPIDSFGAHALVFGGFVAVLMSQPDFGSSVIMCVLIGIMLFVGGARLAWILGVIGLGVVLIVWAVSSAEYRMGRVEAWLDPWQHQQEGGWQLVSGFVALARGGMTGTGFGLGEARYGYVPELYNDFVAAAIGEEFGLLGMATLALLYVIVLWRGLVISKRAPDAFGSYLALGITMLICIQAIVNLWVVTGLFPTKGLTLPFVSAGRSSLLILLFSVGILLNIAQANPDLHAERKRTREEQRRAMETQRVSAEVSQRRAARLAAQLGRKR